MTRVYIHPAMYYCDGPRCSASAVGSDVELPKGWREESVSHPKEPDYHLAHLCPKCIPPEAADVEGGR